MRDGRVCGMKCYREKCHNHTSTRMEKDRLFHKNRRTQKKVNDVHEPKDTQDMHDAQDMHDVLPVLSSKNSLTTTEQSFTTAEQSFTMPDQKNNSNQSHASLTSHTHPEKVTPVAQDIHSSDRALCEKIGSVERWVYEVGKKINSMQTIPDGFTSKRDMISRILDKLMKDIYDINHKKITKNDFYSRIKRHYAEINSKYGSVLQNLR